jgi:hypothetical protein
MDTVVDLEVSGELVVVNSYPHNNKDMVRKLVSKYPTAIEEFAKKNAKDTLMRFVTVVLTEDGVRAIQESDFDGYFCSDEVKTEMFIFKTSIDKGGFPHIYVMEEQTRIGPYKDCLKFFAQTSRDLADPIALQTLSGKELTYILYNSWSRGGFEPEVPSMSQLKFPTRGNSEIPHYLKSDSLRHFGEVVSRSLHVQTDGKEIITDTEEETVRLPFTNPFGSVDDAILERWVKQGIKDASCVSLSDLFAFGLEETIQLITDHERIISVVMDIPDAAKKMCIYQGQLHILPLRQEFDPETMFGVSLESCRICTEDTYPKYFLPPITVKSE